MSGTRGPTVAGELLGVRGMVSVVTLPGSEGRRGLYTVGERASVPGGQGEQWAIFSCLIMPVVRGSRLTLWRVIGRLKTGVHQWTLVFVQFLYHARVLSGHNEADMRIH